jgi:hypothetical protein
VSSLGIISGSRFASSLWSAHESKWMRKRSSVCSIARASAARVARQLRQLADVVALVAVLGRVLPAPDRLDRLAELVHLRARVVVVVLALDLVAADSRRRASESPIAPFRAAETTIGPVGFAETISTCTRSRRSRNPPPKPGSSASASAFENHESARNRLTNPGPATSALSTSGSSAAGRGELLAELPRRALMDRRKPGARTFVA